MDTETTTDATQPIGTASPYPETPGEPPVTEPTEQDLFANLEFKSTEDNSILEVESTALSVPSYHGVPAALSHKMAKFLSNDQLAKIKDLLQIHLPWPVGNPEIPVEGCPLLNLLNLDCRRLIWKLLLVNPLLGENYPIDYELVSLGLFPKILRVNRQIYNEGMDILYGSNKFLIGCISYDSYSWGSRFGQLCALTRAQAGSDSSIIPAARYVQHWKVLISAVASESHLTDDLLPLCRNIYMANIQSLEVLIIPRGIERGWSTSDNYSSEDQLAITLSPLERLRNVQQLIIRPAELHEIPRNAFDEELADEFIPILPSPVDEIRLTSLIQGNSEVETIEEMYKILLAYAQAFERLEDFQSAMDINDIKNDAEHIYSFSNPRNIHLSGKEINPFKASCHPVERALSAAKTSMLEDKMDQFKVNRSILIQYLEPEYQIIEAASKNLVDYIKINKLEGGFFHQPEYFDNDADEDGVAWPNDIATKALVLLEDYSASFKRKLEPATKVEIRRYKLLFNALYDDLPRERLMKLCDMAYEKQWWVQFVKYFQQAVNDMDSQYLAIRHARKKLYAWDLQGTVREVDVKPTLSDEMIDWNECEPDMRIKKKWHENPSHEEHHFSDHAYNEDSDDSGND